jgi:hypothetical protein
LPGASGACFERFAGGTQRAEMGKHRASLSPTGKRPVAGGKMPLRSFPRRRESIIAGISRAFGIWVPAFAGTTQGSSRRANFLVIPAKAGIHNPRPIESLRSMGPRFRGDDTEPTLRRLYSLISGAGSARIPVFLFPSNMRGWSAGRRQDAALRRPLAEPCDRPHRAPTASPCCQGSPLAGCARPMTLGAAPPGAPPRRALSARRAFLRLVMPLEGALGEQGY